MSRTRSFIHTSNYRSNAVSVIDTKWWIKWPDDSQRQNQSVSQHATLGRQRHIHLLMILDLFTDHWALDPPGKMCAFAVERRTGACCMQMTVEPIKVPEVRFSVWVWFFWKPDRGASTDLYLSPSSSLNTLRCDCFRFYFFKKSIQDSSLYLESPLQWVQWKGGRANGLRTMWDTSFTMIK